MASGSECPVRQPAAAIEFQQPEPWQIASTSELARSAAANSPERKAGLPAVEAGGDLGTGGIRKWVEVALAQRVADGGVGEPGGQRARAHRASVVPTRPKGRAVKSARVASSNDSASRSSDLVGPTPIGNGVLMRGASRSSSARSPSIRHFEPLPAASAPKRGLLVFGRSGGLVSSLERCRQRAPIAHTEVMSDATRVSQPRAMASALVVYASAVTNV